MSNAKQLPDKKTSIPKQTYALLFSEVVQYCHQRVDTLDKFSSQLREMGYPIGCTILEVLEQNQSIGYKRQTKPIPVLLQLKDKIWQYLFGTSANDLEQQMDDANCYMLYDNNPMLTQYISHPQDIKNAFSCCSFVAGIIQGILCSSGFKCDVTCHPNPGQGFPDRVVYLIKFLEDYK